MKVAELFEARDSSEDLLAGLALAREELENVRPGGKWSQHQPHYNKSANKVGEYSYETEVRGQPIEATLNVSYDHHQGEGSIPIYHFSYYKFGKPGKKARMFNPQADSGPFLKFGELSSLDKELGKWEGYILDGLEREEKRTADAIERIRIEDEKSRLRQERAAKRKAKVSEAKGSKIVQDHPFSVEILSKGKDKMWPALKGEIYEKDVLIGTFSRGAVRDGFVPPIKYKFRTEKAKSRFDDFADSLSIEETIEALLP